VTRAMNSRSAARLHLHHLTQPRGSENHERRMFRPLSIRFTYKPLLHLSCLSFIYFFSVMPRSRFSSTPVTRAMNSRSAARLHLHHLTQPRGSENHERRMFRPLSIRVTYKPLLHLSCLSFIFFFSVMPRSRFSSTPVTRAMNSRSAARLHLHHLTQPRGSENHERRMFRPLSIRVTYKPLLHLSCLSFIYFFSVMPRSRFSSTPVTRAMNSRSAARLHLHHLTQPRGSENHERRMFRPLSIRVTYKPLLHLSCLSFIYFFSVMPRSRFSSTPVTRAMNSRSAARFFPLTFLT
jgi:hypothetical protein